MDHLSVYHYLQSSNSVSTSQNVHLQVSTLSKEGFGELRYKRDTSREVGALLYSPSVTPTSLLGDPAICELSNHSQ